MNVPPVPICWLLLSFFYHAPLSLSILFFHLSVIAVSCQESRSYYGGGDFEKATLSSAPPPLAAAAAAAASPPSVQQQHRLRSDLRGRFFLVLHPGGTPTQLLLLSTFLVYYKGKWRRGTLPLTYEVLCKQLYYTLPLPLFLSPPMCTKLSLCVSERGSKTG